MKKDRFFNYGEKETVHLSGQDKLLSSLIARYGIIKRKTNLDVFRSLTRSLISQLISSKAAATIFGRLNNLLENNISPEEFLKQNPSDLRSCGVSEKKIENIKNIANAIINKEISREKFEKLNDQEIIQILTGFPGIGKWTAEMFLIFCMERKNIISHGDFVIRKAIKDLYGFKKLDKKTFNVITERYSPYATIASFYLWKHGNSIEN